MGKLRVQSWKASVTALRLLSAALSITPLIASDPTDIIEPQALTKQLGHDDFQTREKALSELWKIGEKSLPALRETATGKDPEAAIRAEELLLYISVGLLHDSPAEVISLALQYSDATPDSQYAILTKLSTQGYWKQALRLINRTKAQNIPPNTIILANTLVTHHARQAILSGDLEQAEETLSMAPDSKDTYMLQAWFYKHLKGDDFAQQLTKYTTLEGAQGAQRRMALHCINGDTAAALAEAQKTKDSEMIQMLQVLEGDAKPWLNHQLNSQVISDGIKRSWELQLLRLNGEHEKAQELADSILRDAHDNLNTINDEQDSYLSIASLASNGYKDYALEILQKNHPESAAHYYRVTDEPTASLMSLGIPEGAVAPYTDWVATVTDQALEDPKYYEHLLALATFHHYHGEPQHTISVMSPIMTQLEKDDSADWYEILANMTTAFMGQEALTFLTKRGNQNDALDLGLACFLLRDNEQNLAAWQQLMWDFIKTRNPGNHAQSLRQIALLSGLIADPEGETTKLQQELTTTFSNLPANEQAPYFDSLYNFTKARNDFTLAHQMAEERAKKEPAWGKVSQFFDITFQNWATVEDYLAQRAKESPSNYSYGIDWYICLRKLGKDKQAADVYRGILLFTMMDSAALNDIAAKLHEVGYDEEALSLWQIILLNKPRLTEESINSIYSLIAKGEHLYHTSQWGKSAAIKEIYLQLALRGHITHESFSHHLNTRFYADFCHGMALHQQGKRKESIAMLNHSRKIASTGTLADEFFPAIRKIDIGANYGEWFEASYQQVKSACELYPHAHNIQNTAAWLSSRAVMRLDDGLAHAKIATTLRPHQGAYLDTMAEIWFAKGNRPRAIEWSKKATKGALSHAQGSPTSDASAFANFKMLKKQQDHLRNDPLPKPYKAGKN